MGRGCWAEAAIRENSGLAALLCIPLRKGGTDGRQLEADDHRGRAPLPGADQDRGRGGWNRPPPHEGSMRGGGVFPGYGPRRLLWRGGAPDRSPIPAAGVSRFLRGSAETAGP